MKKKKKRQNERKTDKFEPGETGEGNTRREDEDARREEEDKQKINTGLAQSKDA